MLFAAEHNLDAKMIFKQKTTMELRSQLEQTLTNTMAADFKQIIIQGYSNIKTFKDALQQLQHIQQQPEEKIKLYVTQFSSCHEVSHNLPPADQDDPWVIQRFINSLNSDWVTEKLNRDDHLPVTLAQAFNRATEYYLREETREANRVS